VELAELTDSEPVALLSGGRHVNIIPDDRLTFSVDIRSQGIEPRSRVIRAGGADYLWTDLLVFASWGSAAQLHRQHLTLRRYVARSWIACVTHEI